MSANDTVTIYIDDIAYDVPKGANLVDVAKFHADVDIPVFCYHPKMEPVGMCRMCLVELGSLQFDRDTGEVLKDDKGQPQVRWFPKLQTACTTTVSNGMVVRTKTDVVVEGRNNIVEFILTSHPLDCPICDKGGECPLQNLTMQHGPGTSRFYFDDKLKLDKHVPLGELIYLDRERCIQCARCTRFCDEVVGDDVLAFHERGRSLQIITISDPPFNTYYSGNTTDICPVGALTTADFRFGARPWELKEIPSIDPYGPEGANISLSTRLDRDYGGVVKVKRVMPRQNEAVNEIWISDKTRFGHHFTLATDRLQTPMKRVTSGHEATDWATVNSLIAEKLKPGLTVGAIAGPALSNEDLWELRKLVETLGGGQLGIYPATMTGAEVIQQVGLTKGSNLKDLGKGTLIIVVASDLQEEAPIWWLRVKNASDRGATVITLNARPTKLDKYANHTITYNYGEALTALQNLKKHTAWSQVKDAQNLVVFCGAEGLTLAQHGALMNACGNLLIETGHAGKLNSGLVAVWEGPNVQGALDLGFSAEATLALYQDPPAVLFIAGCDPIGEDMAASRLGGASFIIVNSLFENATTAVADVILPSQSFAERDGTFTSGERRVQRFYAAQGVIGQSQPDWKAFAQWRHAEDGSAMPRLAAGVFAEIAQKLPAYVGMSYAGLAKVERQFPDVGGQDLYYGGTAYKNMGGLGLQTPTTAETDTVSAFKVEKNASRLEGLTLIPVTRLYDRGQWFYHSALMHQRIGKPFVALNPSTAATHKVTDNSMVAVKLNGQEFRLKARVLDDVPADILLLPKRMMPKAGPFAPMPVDSIETIAEPVGVEG